MVPMMSRVAGLLVLLVASIGPAAQAGDWPQFRGPTGQGHATAHDLPLEWSESRNIVWKTPVRGAGWSSPAVGGGRVWLTTVVERGGGGGRPGVASLRALAFDEATGRQVLDVEVFAVPATGPLHQKNTRASPTPVLDGARVYVHFGAEGTAALTTAGEVLWRTQLPYDSQHGNGGSPVLYDDLLIVNCDGNGGEAYVVALDTATGQVRWRTDRRRPADQAYSTPLVIRVGDRDQVVSPGAHRAVAYDPLTGEEIWRVAYPNGFSNVPRPVYGHGLVFLATGFNEPTMIAVRPDGRGDVTRTHLVWTLSRGAPYTPSPVLVGDELYVVSDTGILTLVDARTGAVISQQRLGGNYSASPVFADGRIYFQSEEGVTTVIAPGRTFRRLAVNPLDGMTLASMAVSGRSIFIRSDRHLYHIAQIAE
jgi:outer membrane protein assembly factor BamB